MQNNLSLMLFDFVLGAAAGSFLNLCAYRIPKKEPFIFGRSMCPLCMHVLGACDLVPVLSFMWLKGRCRYCYAKISLRYPLVELFLGFIFVLVVSKYGFIFLAVFKLAMINILVIASLIDFDHLYIPNELIVIGMICSIILNGLFSVMPFKVMAQGFLVGGLLMYVVYFFGKGGMGAGDVKLSAMFGMYLGPKFTVIALFFGFLSGSIIGVLLILLRKKGRKDVIPFAPFLTFGCIVSSLWGLEIGSWYQKIWGL